MIAILDSGLGGLSVMTEIVRLMPYENITYMADTANCPYGNRSKNEIIELSTKCVDRLINDLGADIVVLACNTITAAAAQTLRQLHPNTPIIGMEPAIKPAVQISKTKVIGVLATKATLTGQRYLNTKTNFAKSEEVIEMAGEGLVEIVENQTQNKPESIALLRKYIEPMIEKGADTIVLGCTHFPFLTDQIRMIAGDSVTIINPAPAVAKHTREVILDQLTNGNTTTKNETSIPQYKYISTRSIEQTRKLEIFATQLLSTI